MPRVDPARVETWVCATHHERIAMGVCVRCGAPLCQECMTNVEGALYCAPCTCQFRRAGTRTHRRALRSLFAKRNDILVLAVSLLVLSLVLYGAGLALAAR
ncbi:MAG: hypothetical protein HY720_00910 [Planctomycetes bacterium]|nr:hypothetical protein [Planctomycetota bacterium]